MALADAEKLVKERFEGNQEAKPKSGTVRPTNSANISSQASLNEKKCIASTRALIAHLPLRYKKKRRKR